MLSLHSAKAATIGLLLSLPLIQAQQLNFPECVNQCIDQSTDDSCPLSDVKCICRQSNGRFLPDVVVCVKQECDNNIDVEVLLGPMELVCRLIGTPVSDAALDNARNIATADTVTETVYSPVVVPTGGSDSEDTTTDEDEQSTATRTAGQKITITETRAQSESPTPTSEENSDEDEQDGPDVAVVIVLTTDSEGSTQTSTYTTETTFQTQTSEEQSEETTTDSDATITDSPTENADATSTRQPRTTTVTQGGDANGGSPFNNNNPDGAASKDFLPSMWALGLALGFTYLLA